MIKIIKEEQDSKQKLDFYKSYTKIWKQVREIMQQIKQINKYSDKQDEYMKLTIMDISRLLEDVSNTLKEKIKEINSKK